MPLVYKTVIPLILVLIGTAAFIGFYFDQTLSDSFLEEQFQATRDLVAPAARDTGLTEYLASSEDPEAMLRFSRFVERVKDSKTARVTVWSPEHIVLYSDLASIVGTSAGENTSLAQAFSLGTAFYVRQERDSGIPRQSNVGPFLDIFIPLENNGVIAAVVEIHAVSGAILGPLNRGIQNAALLTVAGLIAVALIIVLIFRFFILQPLQEAGALARAVSSGDFSSHHISAGRDEIGELVGNLDRMRLKLASLVGNLESAVAARTAELAEEKNRLTASLGSLSAGFVIFDIHEQVIYHNEALAIVLAGVTPSFAALTKALGETANLKARYQAALEKGERTDRSGIAYGAQFLRLVLAPVAGGEGKPIAGVVLFVEDVTEAKALERAKDDFLSIASHELRTPLTAIRANSAFLMDALPKRAKKETRAMVEDIHAASVRLIKIVHDFLDVAALERGVPLTLEDAVDVRALAENVVEDLTPLALEKKLSLTLEGGSALPPARADSDRLKQVLTNLIGNSLRYTERGSVRVTIEQEQGSIVVRVTDTGAGITPEHQSLLFRKFQQADEGVMTRAHSEGTGLGLYITKLIMEAMGGTVALERSTPGEGSVFRASIPVSRA